MTERSPVDLIDAVNRRISSVRTRSLDLSFNELLDMYESGELVIDPDYQRMFRWSEGSQSRFIESLVLEMPVPPIFVMERSEGTYELVDGLQRLGSYIRFRGKYLGPTPEQLDRQAEIEAELEDELASKTDDVEEDGDELLPGLAGKLRLTECDIVSELNDCTFDDLPNAIQIKLKRNFIRVEVLRKETSSSMRYYMFKRLNTGGVKLEPQEVRNCIIRLLGTTFNDFLNEICRDRSFKTCIGNISLEQKKQKYDQELALRFLACKNYRKRFKHDVGDFLTEYMEGVSDERNETGLRLPFDYDAERKDFLKTFSLLAKSLGEHAFSGLNKSDNFVSTFLVYHFEAVTLGLQTTLHLYDPEKDGDVQKLNDALMALKKDPHFQSLTRGGGKNTSSQLKKRIAYVEQKLGVVQ
jgi:hypothetical protein